MAFLGFVWLGLLLAELTIGLSPTFKFLSATIWVIFILDFLLRLVLAPKKLSYLKKNWLTAISLFVPALRVLRFVRAFHFIRGVQLVKIVGSLNRSMKSLGATMKRRGIKYVVALTLVMIFGGAAGMYAFEHTQGLKSYGESLWWTAMLITSLGSQYWPQSGEGKALCLLLAVYGFCVFGYITATLASFFVGRDAEEADAPVAGGKEVEELKKLVTSLSAKIDELKTEIKKQPSS